MEDGGLAAKQREENIFEGFEALTDHLGRLLADEYAVLMKKSQEEKDEGGNLCPVFERESEAGEY